MSNRKTFVIQSIVFPKETKHMTCVGLFYRGENGYLDREHGKLTLGTGQKCDLNTYINSCSWGKWRRYTCAEKVTLILDIEGSYELRYTGYSLEYDEPVRKEFGVITNVGSKRENVSFEYPDNDETVVGVEITAIDKCTIHGGYYEADYSGQLNEVNLSIATTTFRKEDYIRKNVDLIKDEIFTGDDEIKDHLTLHVIDNGRTLKDEEIAGEHVFLHPNQNVGGSGGFARGMIESLHQEVPATHVLLMDDDVLILPESIKRTYHLLRMLKEEYRDHFISGAMLMYEEPWIQHEDIGVVEGGFAFIPLKTGGDLNELHTIVKNDGAFFSADNQYAAWWYCCIPVSVIKENGLPFPFFVRIDDVEYGLRCKAKILTMNSICIWHMGFASKYSAVMNVYLTSRNMHIAKAASGVLQDLDIHRDYVNGFYYQLLRFEYGSCELMIQSFEDYLKGPEFIASCNGEEIVKEKSAYNEKLIPLEGRRGIRVQEIMDIYKEESMRAYSRAFDKVVAHLTINGQRLFPEFLYKNSKEPVKAAYGGNIPIINVARRKEFIVINPYTETYAERHMDKKRAKELLKRFKQVEKRYQKTHETVDEEYRKAAKHLTSEEFWKKYLGI